MRTKALSGTTSHVFDNLKVAHPHIDVVGVVKNCPWNEQTKAENLKEVQLHQMVKVLNGFCEGVLVVV
jgi:hypothetical protein